LSKNPLKLTLSVRYFSHSPPKIEAAWAGVAMNKERRKYKGKIFVR